MEFLRPFPIVEYRSVGLMDVVRMRIAYIARLPMRMLVAVLRWLAGAIESTASVPHKNRRTRRREQWERNHPYSTIMRDVPWYKYSSMNDILYKELDMYYSRKRSRSKSSSGIIDVL